jgi:hypothetical protein
LSSELKFAREPRQQIPQLRERANNITALLLREPLLRWTELRTHRRVRGGLLVSVEK